MMRGIWNAQHCFTLVSLTFGEAVHSLAGPWDSMSGPSALDIALVWNLGAALQELMG